MRAALDRSNGGTIWSAVGSQSHAHGAARVTVVGTLHEAAHGRGTRAKKPQASALALVDRATLAVERTMALPVDGDDAGVH